MHGARCMFEEEPTLSDMLSDPIFLQLLASDRITEVEFRRFWAVETARHKRGVAELVVQHLEGDIKASSNDNVELDAVIWSGGGCLWPEFREYGRSLPCRMRVAVPVLSLDLRI